MLAKRQDGDCRPKRSPTSSIGVTAILETTEECKDVMGTVNKPTSCLLFFSFLFFLLSATSKSVKNNARTRLSARTCSVVQISETRLFFFFPAIVLYLWELTTPRKTLLKDFFFSFCSPVHSPASYPKYISYLSFLMLDTVMTMLIEARSPNTKKK